MRCSWRTLATAAFCLGLLGFHGSGERVAQAGGMHFGGGGMHFGGGGFHGGGFHGGGFHGGGFHGGNFSGGSFSSGHISSGGVSSGRISGLSSGSMHLNSTAIHGFSPNASSFTNVRAFSAHSSFSGAHALKGTGSVNTAHTAIASKAGGSRAVGLLNSSGNSSTQSGAFFMRHGGTTHLTSAGNSLGKSGVGTASWHAGSTGAKSLGGSPPGTVGKGLGYEHLFSGWGHGVLLPRGYNWGQNLIRNGLYYRYWPRYSYLGVCGYYNNFGYFGWPNLIAWGLYNLSGSWCGYGGYGGYAGYCGGYGYGLLPATAPVGYGYAGGGFYGQPQATVAFADPNANLAAATSPAIPQATADANGAVKSGNRDVENARIFAEKGENEFRAKDYQAAVYSWKHALTDDPKNGVLTLMLAQGFLAVGQYNEAAGATQQAMQLLPKEEWGVVVKNYKELYGTGPDYVNQVKALEKSLAAKPNDPALRFLAGYQYGYLGYPKQALEQLDKCLQVAPRDEMAKRLREELSNQVPQPAVKVK